MASLMSRPGRRYWIQFTYETKRHTWRLGKIKKSLASKYKLMIENLVDARRSGDKVDKVVAEWIAELPPPQKDWLRNHGLIAVSAKPHLLKPFGEFVIKEHYSNSAPNTVRNMQVAINGMVEYFGNKSLREITKGDLEVWREDMESESAASATIAFYLKKSRRILRLAVDHGVLDESPFSKISIPSEKNPARKLYVDHDTIKNLLRVCSPDWQAAICLCRFGGMRFPSEVFGLEWDRVNFDLNRIVVYRQKTKRDVAIPMLPEELHTMRNLWKATNKTHRFVFPHYATNQSDRSGYQQLKRLVIRAGLTPWERLTTNLRVSLAVDLKLAGLPAETIAEWLDHTEDVHADHYDLISDEEFRRASCVDSGIFGGVPPTPHAAKPDET